MTIAAVYGIEETLKKTFLSTAQEVLRGAASLADELTQFSESCVGEISRVAAHLNLAYRQVSPRLGIPSLLLSTDMISVLSWLLGRFYSIC